MRNPLRRTPAIKPKFQQAPETPPTVDPDAERLAQIDDQLRQVTSTAMRDWLLDERLRLLPVAGRQPGREDGS